MGRNVALTPLPTSTGTSADEHKGFFHLSINLFPSLMWGFCATTGDKNDNNVGEATIHKSKPRLCHWKYYDHLMKAA